MVNESHADVVVIVVFEFNYIIELWTTNENVTSI